MVTIVPTFPQAAGRRPGRRLDPLPRAVALVGLLLAAAACAPPTGREGQAVTHDLLALLPVAQAEAEVGELDLGSDAARPHLLAGWSWNETAGDGTSFVWSDGEASSLELYLAVPRPLALRFRAFPFPAPEAPPQVVSVAVNGRAAGEVELAPGPEAYEVELPAAALVAGLNRLTFHYRWTRVPAPAGAGGDRRRLAVGWDWLRLGASAAAEEPRADEAAGFLFLPHGSQVSYYLDLRAGSALGFDRVAGRGGAGRLEVEVEREGGGEVWVEAVGRSPAPLLLDLPAAERGLARLTLRAVSADGEPTAGGGVVLARPVVLAPAEGGAEPAPGSPGSPRAAGAGTGADGEPAAAKEPAASRSAPRPPIVLYLVDTLRADRLGCYGASRPTSPRLDAFAAEASLYEHAVAQTSWTKTAVASLFTGLWPPAHGLANPTHALPAEVPLLAEILQRAGYRTAAFVANAHITRESGFARGFDHFEALLEEPNDSAAVNRRVFAWLEEAQGEAGAGEPFFLYVHTIDPHAPYQPPERWRRRFASQVADPRVGSVESIRAIARGEVEVTDGLVADLLALYDAEVAANDHAFGELLDELARRGLYDGALIAFLSDHGEGLHEHGVLGHGWDLYTEVLQVPLVIRWPRAQRAGRFPRPVQHIDLAPTLLAHLGLPAPPGLGGRDLRRLGAAPGRLGARRKLFSHMDYEGRAGASVVAGPWHLIEPLVPRFAPRTELYHRPTDPAEARDLAAERPVLAGYLRQQLRARLLESRGGFTAPAVDLDAATRRRLEALGYLN